MQYNIIITILTKLYDIMQPMPKDYPRSAENTTAFFSSSFLACTTRSAVRHM